LPSKRSGPARPRAYSTTTPPGARTRM
jgi:hypothetical protein